MEQNNNPKKQLFFDENFLNVSAAILQKYKLEETPEELVEKLKNNQPVFSKIFMAAVKGLIGKSIKETELMPLLKSSLNISEESAKNLAIDIKEKILPLIKEAEVPTEEQMEITQQVPIVEKEKLESNPPNMGPIKTKAIEMPKISKKIEKKPTQKIESIQKKGPDSYREPIE